MSHSTVVSGSIAARVLACPPSRLIPAVHKPNVYAAEGTALHAAVVAQLYDEHLPDVVTVDGFDIDIAALIDATVAPALQAFNQYLIEHEITEYANEIEVVIPQIPGASGTADVIAHTGDTVLHVLDWKFGSQQIDVNDNAQLLFYAAGALLSIPQAQHVIDVYLVIIQPNDRGEPILREQRVTRFDVLEFASALRWAVNHPDVPRVAGPHCKYCPDRAMCPTLREFATAMTVWANPHPTVTPATVATMLDAAELVELQISALREHAYDMAENGQPPPGWKLVPKRVTRKWIDEKAAAAALYADNPTLDPGDMFETKIKSPAQMEKLKVKLPNDLIEARSSGTTLVRAADARTAVPGSQPLKRLAEALKGKP